MESAGNIGSRRREGKKYAVEDEALDRIAKEVSTYYKYSTVDIKVFAPHVKKLLTTLTEEAPQGIAQSKDYMGLWERAD